MNTRPFSGFFLALFPAFVVITGCGVDSTATEAEVASDALTAPQCTAKITQEVLKRARKITDTAELATDNSYGGVKSLYGNEQSAAVTLVRISDETERSDYLVIQAFEPGNACKLSKVLVAAEGRVPEGTKFTQGTIGKGCKASIEAAVLKQARKVSDEPTVQGMKLIYGGDVIFGGAAIVRTSDETDPSHYVVSFSLNGDADQRAGTCKVEYTQLVADGLLPPVAGLIGL